MRRTSKTDSRVRGLLRLVSHRPVVETLEDRLPPGDILLGGGLLGSWMGQSFSVLDAASLRGMNSAAETRLDYGRTAQSSGRVASEVQRPGSTPLFAMSLFPSPEERNATRAESTPAENQAPPQHKPAFRHMSGLDDNLLDQLVADDFDTLLSSRSSSSASRRSIADTPDVQNRAPNGVEAAAGASSISAGAGSQAFNSPSADGLPPPPAEGVGPSTHGLIGPPSIGIQPGAPIRLPGDGTGINTHSLSTLPFDTPPICDCDCDCSGGSGGSGDLIDCAPGAYDHSIDPKSVFSPSGVRYFDGSLKLYTTDLSSSGYGVRWGQTRSWTNTFVSNNSNGLGVIDSQQPTLIQNTPGSDSTIIVVSSAANVRYFDLNAGVYVPHFFLQEQLTHNIATQEFVLATTGGRQLHFYDFAVTPTNERGHFKSISDPDGNSTTGSYSAVDGTLSEVQRTDTSSGVTESYLYSYQPTGVGNALQLSNVTLRRQINGGPWTTVRQVAYDYYDGVAPYGNVGDLRKATIADAAANVLDVKYYRYYTGEAGGYLHGLKYVFSPQSYARLAAGVGNPLTATDAQVGPYADDYYQYDSSQRITQAVVQAGGCSSCTGGLGTFTFSYSTSSFTSDYNNWSYKTVETLPDGNTNIVYANYAGEVMLKVFQSGSQKWETYYKYDGKGRVIQKANPSALTGYNEALAHLVDGYISTNSGLIELTDYGTSTSAADGVVGDVLGYFKDSKLEQGMAGSPTALQASVQYFLHSGGGATVYPVATSTVYRNQTTNLSDPSAETTSYTYTWYPGITGTVQMQTATVNRPVILAAENGPGVADTETRSYDVYGRLTQVTDADSYVHTTQYDQATGAVTQTVVDSGTGHLNLTTTMVVDTLGRTTALTDPNGNITYTVYNDPNHEVRTYPGWTGTTTTGPTQVYREDRAHDPSYTETFAMSAAPHLTGTQPDGTEAYAFLQSLSRKITSRGGQVIESDAYFNLGGVPYSANTYMGTAGTNFNATLYKYDTPRGWLTRVQAPTGTISRTVYDGLGRVVSGWVGTNDTPASGSWSPSNNTPPSNMVRVTSNVYDDASGGGGDSNLIQVTQFPGGSAQSRVTKNYYDWRDRLVASKQGVQGSESDGTHRPILYSQLDNLSEVIFSERYDGDGVTVTTTNGVPNRPSASLLRAKTTPQYDEQGRIFQSNTFSVDQTNGTVSVNSLTTNTWYDHRGNVIKTSAPGGLATKTSYDGAGRPTTVYTTDAYLDSSWSDATTVSSNNNVLSQRQTVYDSNGNATSVTTKDRFDNETQGGPLGNSATHPYARVSYVANYYDAASRLTDAVNVGTNGGTSYTRPGTPDARSDTTLVTSTGYKADAVQQVALTGSPTGGTFTLTFGGQTTAAIAFNAAAAAVQSSLQSLSTIGSGNALVSGPAGGPWLVRFASALAETPEAEMTGNGSGLTGGTSPSVSIGTTSQGGDTGRIQKVTDPRALVTKTDYDLLGRTLRTVENFVAFAPSDSADRTTQYSYDGNGHVLTLTAVLPGNVLETTQYTYGVTGSVINSNDLLAAVTYPANGQANIESYTYNALGQPLTKADRNGNTHSYTYDILGRQTRDTVTAFGSGVDQAVKRIDTAYDTGGRPYLYTSYADTGGATIVNQVQQVYNGLGQLITEYQSHSGAVNISTTPKVQYGYSFVATSGGPNHSRLVSITYPNTAVVRVVSYNYNTGVDDRISRVSSLSDSSATLESYAYLGLGTVVKRAHPQPGVDLTYIKQTGEADGDAGDQYTGLDRFGRVVDQRWIPAASPTNPTDRFQYTYDRDGNRLTRTNLLNTSFNEQYGCDNLNQLTSFSRGTHTQSWSLDAVGNWSGFTNDVTAPPTQNRTHNVQNQITSITSTPPLTTPTYDNNGNTTTDDTGKTLVYDAWNRLVRYNGATTVSYAHDALNRRISSAAGGTTTDLYYSANWQALEERVGGVMQTQYVWSPVYVDALVERDTTSQRLYAQQDANWNVTAVLDTTGNVQERYAYDPYGRPTDGNGNAAVLTPAWASRATSLFSWLYLHQSGRMDITSGLYHFRNRDYSPALGRWMQQDPVGYSGGYADLYIFAGDNPAKYTDPSGLAPPLHDRIHPCPCTIKDLQQFQNDHPGVTVSEDKRWVIEEFHPGADRSFRIYDPAKDILAGNQCTYDSKGNLVTVGAGAGTPDYFSSESSVIDHFLVDVLPFILGGKDWQSYHQDPGWRPFSCPGCKENRGDPPKPKPPSKPLLGPVPRGVLIR